jgi:DNA polymerase-3 subunit epsilon
MVEIAVIELNADGDVVDEYDTLVNPMRSVGPSHVHGVTAAMVSAAPTFDEIAAAVAMRIDGAALVAHNLPFDARFLRQEFVRIEAELDPGSGLCTYRLTGAKLASACQQFGVRLEHHHRALADARATACLLKKVLRRTTTRIPAAVRKLRHAFRPRTFRREASDETNVVRRLANTIVRSFRESADADELRYLDAVDRAFNDRTLTMQEASELRVLATELGFDDARVERAHRRYLEMLISAALRDGVVTAAEHRLLRRAADAFGFPAAALPEISG